MSDQFIDTVMSVHGGSRGTNSIETIIDEGNGRSSRPAATEPGPRGDTVGERAGHREISEALREQMAKVHAESKEARRAARGAADREDDADEPSGADAADPDAPPGEAAPEQAAKAEDKPAESDPVADLKAKIARYEAANAKLVEDLETEKKRERPTVVPHKLLAEARDEYLEDSTTAYRKFIAASLGVDDPKSPEVDEEIRLHYLELTHKEMGVTPDQAQQAKRDAARAKQLWAREKRERKANEQSQVDKTQSETDSKATNAVISSIESRLTQKASDYPLLVNLAREFDGLEPAALVLKIFQREVQTGRIDPKQSDEALIDQTAKLIEDHYNARHQALSDKFAKAKPVSKPSTAQPTEAVAKSDSTEQRQSHGARTLTAADASVAPATPPAKKPAPKKDERPVFKNDDERRRWALRHIRNAK